MTVRAGSRRILAKQAWIRPPGPIAPGLRIGLLGGSFNPAHEGHVHVTRVALEVLKLDYVWWLVSPQNPLKPVAGMAPLSKRAAQARALAGHPRVRVTNLEEKLGTVFTIDTLIALRRRFSEVRFVWLMGSDNLASFDKWHRWTDIAATVPIAVVIRPGSALAPLFSKAAQRLLRARQIFRGNIADASPPALVIVDAPRNNLSSTAIREKRAAAFSGTARR